MQIKLDGALHHTLEKIASGFDAQLGANSGGITFAVLAGELAARGLVRVVRRRDFTRPYKLTAEGKTLLAKLRKAT